MPILFSKMSGSGNDFIIIDNRKGEIGYIMSDDFVRKVCTRGLSIGADGFILIEESDKADFKWRFYNSDGTIPAMCGNGSRCAARFAYMNRIAPREMTFETDAGIIEGYVMDGTNVKVQLTKPHSLVMDKNVTIDGVDYKISSLDTGVPHAVIFSDDVSRVDVRQLGAKVRYHECYSPAGVNVNFVQVMDAHNLKVRTYERGVEGETLACGTGSTASALIAIQKGLVSSPVSVKTSGNMILTIYSSGSKVYLQGDARLVNTGELNIEGYNY